MTMKATKRTTKTNSKKATKTTGRDPFIGKLAVIRDHRAGVHFGRVDEYNLAAKTAVMSNARKVWYWKGAASTHGLAAKGLDHAESKVCPLVTKLGLCDVVDIALCSAEGAANLAAAPVWTP